MVAGYDESAEAETTAAFDDLGTAIDENNFLDGVGRFFGYFFVAAEIAAAGIACIRRHDLILKFKTALTGGVGQSFDFAVILPAAAVEDHFRNGLGFSALCQKFAYRNGIGNIGSSGR